MNADDILAMAERQAKERAEAMPDVESALKQMFQAYHRLQELGFQDIIYCPKDGTFFESVSAGSTSVNETTYWGKWPEGHWWIAEDGDLWPAHPVLWRPGPDEQEAG